MTVIKFIQNINTGNVMGSINHKSYTINLWYLLCTVDYKNQKSYKCKHI